MAWYDVFLPIHGWARRVGDTGGVCAVDEDADDVEGRTGAHAEHVPGGPAVLLQVRGQEGGVQGRGSHSSASQLNLSRF
jgi:hypothetical protein